METTTNSTHATRMRAVRRAYAQLEDLLARTNTRLDADWNGDVWIVHKDEERAPRNGMNKEYPGFPL